MPGELLGEINGAMLPAGASERNHQVLEAAPLILGHTGIDQREDAGKKLVDTLLLVKKFDHWRVLSCERLEAFLAAGVRKAAAVKYEAAAVAGFVPRPAAMK